MSVLQVNQIKKAFGSQEVLKGVSFEVAENSVLGFIGQNGAGKTTLMKMIVGLLKQDEGQIKVCGEEVTYGENQTNQWIGYLPDVPEYYGFMTATSYLTLCGNVTNYPKSDLAGRIEELLVLVGLKNNKKKIKTYSRGMKQRLGIAQALLNKPKLLICDEPTSALDPVGRKEILSILQQVKEETTVIFSTHVLSDVEKICDHIVLLHEGYIKLDVTPEQFRESYQVNKIQLVLSSQKEMDQLKTRFDVEVIDTHKECFVLSSDIEATQAELYAFLLEKKIYPRKIAIYQPTLEDIFTEVVS
ncbi:ABC transporter ATP-binding protein [Vagococcus sp. DIV0080]|uniref:ABC transporter ATP-binding protein n=1 Tax=Candidatus Vagococcus giribetii TaxID=2230876 RepID=A0ABS3HTQ9_9ENTE|nr:ABC transporter ATP-binding protein [Vagococcus sp. DIV0080]MBO0476211.1 ABC transporter ATP-binding protein [Vagococcus sp. DIV0080]